MMPSTRLLIGNVINVALDMLRIYYTDDTG